MLSDETLKSLVTDFFNSYMPAGLVCCDLSEEFSMRYANNFFVTMLGYDSYDELSRSASGAFINLVADEDVRSTMYSSVSEMEYDTHALFTYRIRRKDGSCFWIRDCSHKYTDKSGHSFMLCYCTDVSDIVQLQNDLEVLANNIPGGLARYELSRDAVYASYLSDGVFKLFECSKDEFSEIVKGGFDVLMTPEDRPLLAKHIEALIDEDKDIDFSYRIKTNKGNNKWINIRASAFSRSADTVVANVVFFDVTEAKEAEAALIARDEEYRTAITHCGKTVCFYDIATRTMTLPEDYAKSHGIPSVLSDAPKAYEEEGILDKGSLSLFRKFYNSIDRGEKRGSAEVRIRCADGTWRWECGVFVTVFDLAGNPAKAIITVEDTTLQHEKDAAAMVMKENARLFELAAAHSDRHLIRYDIETQTAYLDAETAQRLSVSPKLERVPEFLIESGIIMTNSVSDCRRFFGDIAHGVSAGHTKLRIMLPDNSRRWLDMKYSVIEIVGEKPKSAAISFADITESHEKELAYELYRQNIERAGTSEGIMFFESDITAGIIEKQGGDMIPSDFPPCGLPRTDFIDYIAQTFLDECDRSRFRAFFSRENMITLYTDGKRTIQSEWRVIFSDGHSSWISAELQMIQDPYTGNIKNYTHISDITEEKSAAIDAQKQAQTDGMTGLYNRSATERLIKERMEEKPGRPCAMLVADLDELKNINDNLGHASGDAAIKLFAHTLINHFRNSDIVGRIGGDEFMVFLDGAREGSSLDAAMKALIVKLAELRVFGSIGVVTGTMGAESFNELYRKADMALYHVKRNGKCDYAVYSNDMEEASYQHMSHARPAPMQKNVFERNHQDRLRLQKLLEVMVALGFEYICILHTDTLIYELYANDGKNTHTVRKIGNFEDAAREIGENHVIPCQKEEYGRVSDIRAIISGMRESGHYRYSYSIADGSREVEFHYYEPTKTELLMTVRKL